MAAKKNGPASLREAPKRPVFANPQNTVTYKTGLFNIAQGLPKTLLLQEVPKELDDSTANQAANQGSHGLLLEVLFIPLEKRWRFQSRIETREMSAI